MLSESLLVTTIAVADLDEARRFYGEQLGLALLDETPFALRFGAGDGSQVSVRRGQPNAGQTAGHFEVTDLNAEMAALRSRGVVFEEYDFPGLKTENGIADIDGERAAWFIDSEGNILSISQLT